MTPNTIHMMPGSSFCCDADASDSACADGEFEIVERDPTRRYGRYTEVLGKGACKTVYKAFDEMDGMEVAWNQVKIPDISQKQEDLDRLCSEVHLLKTLKHKNIIKFYHSWLDMKAKNINFITEIFTSGTLRQYRKRHKRVDMKAVKNWSRQILRGLLYLHSHDPPIIHRDLKCDNIFVNGSQGEVKIGDLGLATILQQAHVAHSVLGTPEFMAPELYEEEYTELVDIYSFGMCLLEMVTFEYPYSECANTAQIYKKVTSGKKPDALGKVKDPEVRRFIEKCIASASERLPARELLTDPFLQSFDHKEGIDYPSPKSQREDTISVKGLLNLSDGSSMGYGSLLNLDMGMDQDSQFPVTEEEEMLSLRSVDFKVKGIRRDGDTVYLGLQFAHSQGHVRNIHFPFDIEVDTAMSVASEMVAELELADQDVTKIAESIDAAILDLVPEWKPGVSIEETCGTTTTTTEEDEDEEDIHSRNLEHLSSEVLSMDPSPPPLLWADSFEGAVHGRFEEVLIDVSDSVRDVDYWDQTEGLSSSSSCSRLALTVTSSFLLDCQCVAEAIHCNNSPKEMWTNIGPGRPCVVEMREHYLSLHSLGDPFEEEEEEKLLALRHERELKELQGRHQNDLSELRRKWEERRILSSFPSLSSSSSSTSLNEHPRGSSSSSSSSDIAYDTDSHVLLP